MLDGDVKELPPVAHVFSREAELGRLRNFVSAGGSARCLSLVGEPGVGKTTLWEAGLDLARTAGATVLWTRASEAETSLSFAALRDLADGVDPGVLAELPTPQRRAIEIAVRLVEPIDLPPDSLAISAGFLGVLRRLAVRRPTVVAIDDVQWLDAASLEVLMFVARRQPSESVRFLFSRRSDTASELERALGPAGLEHVPVAGLSLGAIGRLLGERLNLVPPRRILRRLHQMTQGNPLFALELGRLLAERGIPEVGDELPFPNLYTDIFGERVLALPAPMRRALLAVALCAKLPRTDLEELVDALVVEDAIAAGLLLVERAEIRPSHPLLAAAARHHSTARQRRDLHRDLAEAVGDPILRARHMAVATSRPDPAVAAEVAKAAEIAAERGATEDAEDLAQHGVRLTPPDAPEWPHRLLTLARYHLAVGDSHAVETLLTTHMDGLPAGRVRAQAHILRGWVMDTAREFTELGLALAEAAEDPEVRADVRSRQAVLLAISNVEHLDEAERLAREALDAARQCGTEVQRRVLPALAWALILRGRNLEELGPPGPARPRSSLIETSLERPRGVQWAFRGEVAAARKAFQQMLAQAEMSGEVRAALIMHIQLCELELRCGHPGEAMRHLDELNLWIAHHDLGELMARLQVVLSAVSGKPADAARAAAVVLDHAGASEWDRIEVQRACGISALFEGDAERAVELLWPIWERTLREHVDDPGAFPVAGDLVEALVLAGKATSALDVLDRLRQSGSDQRHPWALTTTDRCAAMIQLNERFDQTAARSLEKAASDLADLGLDFDAARCWLALGRAQRRSKKTGEARRSLERAAAQFEQHGCTGWAELARAEQARISGRRPTSENKLTPSEERVVDLAASGLSNKEIARQLFVSVNTVEEHLSHAYAKLGVRSRSQLAGLAVQRAADQAP